MANEASACPDDGRLLDFVTGAADDADRSLIAAHVDDCQPCCELLCAFAKGVATPQIAVGRFRLGECVGSGSFGRVYQARDTMLDRDVAIKLLPAVDEQEAARWMREAKALAKVNHASVVAVHDAIIDDTSVAIAMELVDGEPLTLQARGANALMLDVCEGIIALHDAGIVHGDIKPDNIIVARGQAKVADLGLCAGGAVTSGDIDTTQVGKIAGTPRYMAPELFAGTRSSVASDQYAIAQVWAELQLGRHLFSQATLERLPRAKAQVPSMSGPLASVLKRALDPVPQNRYDSVHAFYSAAKMALRPTAARRKRWFAALAVALLVVSVGLWWRFDSGSAMASCQAELSGDADEVSLRAAATMCAAGVQPAQVRDCFAQVRAWRKTVGAWERDDYAFQDCAIAPTAAGEISLALARGAINRQAALKRFTEAGDRRSVWRLRRMQLSDRQGRGEDIETSALTLFDELPVGASERGRVAVLVAMSLAQRGNLAAAHTWVRAAEQAGIVGAPWAARVASVRASLAVQSGDYPAAAAQLETAKAALHEFGDLAAADRSRLLTIEGNLERLRKHYPQAIAAHKRALAIDRTRLPQSSPAFGRHYHNLAGVARRQGDLANARRWYEAALRFKRSASDRALTLNSLGILALDSGNSTTALAHLTEAVALTEGLGDESESLSRYNLGLAYARAGQCDKASPHVNHALSIVAAMQSPSHERAIEAQLLSFRCALAQKRIASARRRLARLETVAPQDARVVAAKEAFAARALSKQAAKRRPKKHGDQGPSSVGVPLGEKTHRVTTRSLGSSSSSNTPRSSTQSASSRLTNPPFGSTQYGHTRPYNPTTRSLGSSSSSTKSTSSRNPNQSFGSTQYGHTRP